MSMSITHIELDTTEVTSREQYGTIRWFRFRDYWANKFRWFLAAFS